MTYQLRPYQRAAAQAALDHPGNALLALPTGTGKTVIIAEIVRRHGPGALIVAHRRELVAQANLAMQAHETFATVRSIQSMAGLLGRADPPTLLIIDEAHHATATTYRALISWAGCRVIGVTATPYRLDEGQDEAWKLGDVFGPAPAYSYSLIDAVRDGYLVPIRQWGVSTGCSLDAVGMRGGDLMASGLTLLDCPERNALVATSYRELCPGRQAIAFAVGVEHAQNLAAAFGAVGVPAAAVWGAMPTDARDSTLAEYRAGTLRVVANCELLTEGFDDPATSALLMARPTASRGLYVQMAGRGLRPAPDKSDCVIVDFLDAGGRHQLATQTAWRLAGSPGGQPSELHDAKGRPVVEAAQQAMAEHLLSVADMAERLRVMPLSWTAKDRTPRWSLEHLSLAAYQPEARWQSLPATVAQVKAIKTFRLRPERDLTRGEASVLLDRLSTLESEDPEPASAKQVAALRWRGVAVPEGCTARQARRLFAMARGGRK